MACKNKVLITNIACIKLSILYCTIFWKYDNKILRIIISWYIHSFIQSLRTKLNAKTQKLPRQLPSTQRPIHPSLTAYLKQNKQRAIPTERQPLVGEVSINCCREVSCSRRGESPMAINLSFLDHGRYYFIQATTQLSSRG
jgi:hypothetical protein